MVKVAVYGGALAFCVLAAGCGSSKPAVPTKGTPVAVTASVGKVESLPVDIAYQAVGTTRSKTIATIQSKVLGHVTRVLVSEGDHVDADALLVEVDDRDVAAQLREAESAHTQAAQGLQAVEQSIKAAASALQAAQADLSLAETTYERQKKLLAQRAISQQTYDEAEARYRAASADAQGAADNLRTAEARKREAEAQVQQSAAAVDAARVSLGYTKIIAPFAGVITMKNVDPGDLVSPGVPLLEVEDVQHYRLEAVVDEEHVSAIKMGERVEVSIDALGTRPLAGVVSEIVPKTDPTSRTSLVKVDLPDREGLRSGLFGRATFKGGATETLTVPASAVFEHGQLTGVYVVDAQGIAQLRLVKTGRKLGDRTEVLSGVNAGEVVVTDNLDAVADGFQVKQP